MAFDGILFYKLGLELKALETGKINKIQEASQNEFLFTIRRNKENYKLLISLSANYPRIHITNESYDFPREPKSFTMLLRKYFEGSQIMEITTHETDRVMAITCSKYNDMGDFEKKTLIIEILGRYSNLIVVEDSKILEAFHHLGLGELRVILPNGNYNYPDTLGKINPMNLSLEDLETLVRTNNSPKELSSKILGLSLKTAILAFDSENPSQKLYELIHDNTPCLYFDGKKNDITYYKVDGDTFFPSFSNLLDAYFKEEALKERIKAKTGNIESFIDKQLTRNLNKKHKLEDELQKADEADKYRLYGELLIANNYLSGHKKNITVLNYYTNENVTIPLDERYDIMGNSKLYFKKYQKSKAAPVYPDGTAGTVFNYLFLNLWIFCLCFFIRCKLERDKKMQRRFCVFRSALFSLFAGQIKSFGALDFVAQGVQSYVVRRNRAQKKRKRQISCRNP